ncbi:MAG: LamG domain-containing protein [Ignavibacteriaceae bacterium]
MLLLNFQFTSLSSFSYSLWVKEENMISAAAACFYFRDDLFGEPYAGIMRGGESPEIHFQVGVTSTNGPLIILYQQSYTNKYVHYCLVYNKGEILAYINGDLVGKKTQNAIVDGKYSAIARSWYNVNTTTRFTCTIDEVRIYNRALTEEEIKTLYNDRNRK